MRLGRGEIEDLQNVPRYLIRMKVVGFLEDFDFHSSKKLD